MERKVKINTFGSFTIKRSNTIMNGTRGNGIAKLSNIKDNVNKEENKKKTKDYA